MIRRLPILPTIIVVLAAATMAALGIWQLQRAEEKAQLKAYYAQAAQSDAVVPFPLTAEAEKTALYRQSEVACRQVLSTGAAGARNADGVQGWGQQVRCAIPGGEADVMLGWMRAPETSTWDGGTVRGTIVPAGRTVRLVADPPQAGLDALAQPDPAAIPDNHLAYAGQWFFFAVTALIIYFLAVRRRLASAQDGE